jgi:hypothetical protein
MIESVARNCQALPQAGVAFNLKTLHGHSARESARRPRVPQTIAEGNRFDNES